MTRHRMIETRVTTWGRSIFVALAVVLGGTGVPGCASGRTTFSSQANLAGTAPIKRLVVYEDVGATGLTSEMRMGLQTALANGFAACGITSTVLAASALDLDPGKRVASAAKDFQTASAEFDVKHGGRSTDEVRSGERLGTSIVARLRDDGVLPGCPLVVASWPLIPHPEPPPAKPTHLR